MFLSKRVPRLRVGSLLEEHLYHCAKRTGTLGMGMVIDEVLHIPLNSMVGEID